MKLIRKQPLDGLVKITRELMRANLSRRTMLAAGWRSPPRTKGALSSRDFILATFEETANRPEAIRTIRNLMLLSKVLGNVEPELLDRLAGVIPDGLAEIPKMKTEAPGLVSLLRKLNNPDCRRAMAYTAALLENLGKRLAR